MKKLKLLVLAALMAVMPLAKASELIVNNQGTTTTNEYVPFNAYNADCRNTKSQFIIPASELTSMVNSTISRLTFYATGGKNFGNARWTIYMKEVGTTSTLSQYIDWSSLSSDEVYSGGLILSNNELDITLQNPFQYTGGNLLIAFYQTALGGWLQAAWDGIVAPYGSSIASDYDNPSIYSFLPKTKFTYRVSQPQCDEADKCSIFFYLADSYGDGWNGAYIKVVDANTENELASMTLSGSSQNYEQRICEGTQINLVWANGSYDYECSLTVTDHNGETIYSFPTQTSPNNGTLKTYTVTCSSCPAPTNLNASGITTNYAYITWDGGTATEWELRYKIAGTSTYTTLDNYLSTQYYNLSNLASNTQYTVEVRTICPDEDPTDWVTYDFYTLECSTPTGLTAEYINRDGANIIWDASSVASLGWEVKYKNLSTQETITIDYPTYYNNYYLYNLSPETQYTVYVRALCSSTEESDWADYTFTTLGCTVPTDLNAIDITTGHATITWNNGTASQYEMKYTNLTTNVTTTLVDPIYGSSCDLNGLNASTTYYVELRGVCGEDDYSPWASYQFTTSAPATGTGGTIFEETFETANASIANSNVPALPHRWRTINNSSNSWEKKMSSAVAHNGNYYASHNGYSGGALYLVSPPITMEGSAATFKFWNNSNEYGDTYYTMHSLVISTTGYDASDFTNVLWSEDANHQESWNQVSVNIPSQYLNKQVYFAFLYNADDGDTWYIDDITIEVVAASYNIFQTAGNWDEASNWSEGTVPGATDNVLINAAATIPANYVAYANEITLGQYGSITIADGGQLFHNSSDLGVTLQKNIAGYSGTHDNYYFIASPIVNNVAPTATMLSNNYDLYSFDQTEDLEWRAYEVNSFNLSQGQAYLYANSANTTLSFTGAVSNTSDAIYVPVSYMSGNDCSGFNLVGNPFTCNASVSGANGYYQINADVDGEVIAVSNPIVAPGTGVFAVVDTYTNVTFSSSNNNATVTRGAESLLNIEVLSGEAIIDRAYLSMNECNSVRKFNLRENSTKVYFKDTDVREAKTALNGTSMPLYFDAERQGTYTLSVKFENAYCEYLHLIDNLTGADQDLLANPEYSFEAKPSDYSSRFQLVFAADNENSESFILVDGKHIVVSEGQGRLDVIDMMGHIVSTTTINGRYEAELNLSAGIYLVRLSNNSDVKVEKVVVK